MVSRMEDGMRRSLHNVNFSWHAQKLCQMLEQKWQVSNIKHYAIRWQIYLSVLKAFLLFNQLQAIYKQGWSFIGDRKSAVFASLQNRGSYMEKSEFSNDVFIK